MPRSRALIASTLIPARSASSSWVSEAARRHFLSSIPTGGESTAVISYLHPSSGRAVAFPEGVRT